MKAIGIYEGTATAAEQQFEQLEIKKPMPTDYDLLVKVTAISVNPVDTKVRQATPKQANLKILGYDAVGEWNWPGISSQGVGTASHLCGDER